MVTIGDTEARVKRPVKSFRDLTDEHRTRIVKQFIDAYLSYDITFVSVTKTGQVTVKIGDMPAAMRGERLRMVESRLRQLLGAGIEVWVEPTPDKNRLRQLRGVEV